MKNLFLLLAALFSLTLAAQDYPGARPQLLLNETIKVKPMNERLVAAYYGYEGFYTDEKMLIKYKENARSRTAPDAFGERTFKVVAVDPFSSFGQSRYRIKLQETGGKEVLYYEYNPTTRLGYYIEVIGGLKLPADFYCDLVKEDTNDNGEQELSAGEMYSYYLTRTRKKGNKLVYDLIFETQVDNEETGDGMTIFLMNGEQIERPAAKVIKEKNGATPHYYATIELTPAELQLLSKNRVKSFRLYKHEGFFPQSFAENLQGALNCMMTKK
jgi:hypothetical protein